MPRPLLQSLFEPIERRPLTVTELTGQVRAALEARFPAVWVEGEISNFHEHGSGHWYFTIKDAGAQLRAMCARGTNARIRFRPSDGLQVRARGRLKVYEPRGEYQISVEALDPVGAGALRVAFEQLRDRLAGEGLFADEIKRPLPAHVRRVGIVTSETGAAIHDMLYVLRARTRGVDVLLAPSRVQGEGAGESVAASIALLNEHHRLSVAAGDARGTLDLIIVGRGGGSIEDLWAFNTEEVARAIRASAIPIISAVGHEKDWTIADYVADMRAATPTAAAEIIARLEADALRSVEELTLRLAHGVGAQLAEAHARLREVVSSPAFTDVETRLRDSGERLRAAEHALENAARRMLEQKRRKLETLTRTLSPARTARRASVAASRLAVARERLVAVMRANIEDERGRLAVAVASLDALSPLDVLARGYAIVETERGQIVRRTEDVLRGSRVRVRLRRGALRCVVEDVERIEQK